MRKKAFFSKVMGMTVFMIIFNASDLCYNVFISNRLGEENIGIFHLIMSIWSLGVSVCISGMGLTSTRLLSDMPRTKGLECSDHILFKCLSICICTSLFASFILFFSSGTLSQFALGSGQGKFLIKFLSPFLICISVSSVLNGYFVAFSHIGAIGISRFLSSLTLWLSAFIFLKNKTFSDLTYVPVFSLALSSFAGCCADIILWRKISGESLHQKSDTTYKKIFSFCVPIALGSYLRTGLSSLENLIIVKRLSFGGEADAISKYGIIKGMTMPVLFFPAVFTGAFVSLLVPEIARRFSAGEKNSLRYISSLSIEYIFKFSFLVFAIFFMWSDFFGISLFSNKEAGRYLYLLSFLPVFLFADSVCDALLKGFGENVFALKINTIDSLLRLAIIFFFLPFGIEWYIITLYTSEVFNLFFSYRKLKKITALRFPLAKAVIVPLVSLLLSYGIVAFLSCKNAVSDILCFVALYILSCSFFFTFPRRKKQAESVYLKGRR